jgi:AAA family ATP:ADP antiporter
MVQKKQGRNLAATVRAGSDKNISLGTRIRNVLFPIHGDEVKKFLLIGSIKFFVILALTLTRDNKDTMVVTQCGAESIAFLKVRTYCLHWFTSCSSHY